MPKFFLFMGASLLLSACGYKGTLYLPKEGDRGRYAPVQTGLQFEPIAPMPQSVPPRMIDDQYSE